MSFDLLLRYVIISIAFQLACAWIQSFQKPWPLVDSFELAESAEEQLFRSLGVKFDIASILMLNVGNDSREMRSLLRSM